MALDLVIGPLISLATNKAGDALIEQFCMMYDMKKNREKLHRNLLAIEAVISSAESRAANERHVRAWVDKLRHTAYEAVDVLDEFRYEALRQEANRQKPSSSFKKVTKVIIPDLNFRYKMSKKLKNVLEKINEIIKEMNSFSFIRGIAHDPQPNIRPQTHSLIIESEIIGRESEKEYVMNMLLDPNREKHNVSIFPIVGMGGAGKTTLAQLVYNEKRVSEHFELQMWVCVSNDFAVENIVKSIIEVAQNGKCELPNNMEVLQKHLCTILKNKKYLLVLDDVWNEEINKWDELKKILTSDCKLGSVIIVTTRSENVASIMRTVPPHDLAMLSEEDSWKLFQKRAFGEDEKPEEQLVSLGQKIVGKCGGLPLALKTVGAMMRDKRDIDDWRAISENKLWNSESETGPNDILPALKLSYDHLPGYMKQCFAFCAIFPQDYNINMESLIQLWIANDFILGHEGTDLEYKGRTIFSELCRRSFFQEVRVYVSDIESFDATFEITTCKMHDLMHDLAKHITENQYGSFLHITNIDDQLRLDNLNCALKEHPVLRTCLLPSGFKKVSEDVKHHLLKTISLRALEVRWIDQFPMEVGYMKHLRYLDLSDGKFRTLPETISIMYNLQTLKLTQCSEISKLPDDMRYMASLRHLFINGCRNLKRMPVGLGQLKCLKTLTNYMIECEPGRTISELNQLNLCGQLILSGLEKVKDKNEADDAKLNLKVNLYSLVLKWAVLNDKNSTRNDLEVLDGLKPCTELRFLRVHGYAGNDIAIWMKNTSVLKNLKKLHFRECFNCTTLPPVWCLPLLEELHLDNLDLLYICNSIEGEESKSLKMFPSLKVLKIRNMENLESWHEKNNKQVTFPQLSILHIDWCPKIRMIPCAPLLHYLFISSSDKIKLREISNMNLVALSEVEILCGSLRKGDTFRPPKNVVRLWVRGFENVIPLEEDDEEDHQNMTLRNLIMEESNCFFVRGSSKVALGFWKHFAFLEILHIESCNNLCTWPKEEFRSLKCLKSLAFWYCHNFTGLSHATLSSLSSSIDSSGEDILPQLENLGIHNCPKFKEIPRCCKSIKSLRVWYQPVVWGEELNWLNNLLELQVLELFGCNDLKSLPEGLECLTSLRCLKIWGCPGMESLPQGLQQRLPALETLRIYNCPVLERRCRSGGDYHHLVSAIYN